MLRYGDGTMVGSIVRRQQQGQKRSRKGEEQEENVVGDSEDDWEHEIPLKKAKASGKKVAVEVEDEDPGEVLEPVLTKIKGGGGLKKKATKPPKPTKKSRKRTKVEDEDEDSGEVLEPVSKKIKESGDDDDFLLKKKATATRRRTKTKSSKRTKKKTNDGKQKQKIPHLHPDDGQAKVWYCLFRTSFILYSRTRLRVLSDCCDVLLCK